MPRPAKGIRLWLRPEERDATGRIVRNAQWVIRDGSRRVPTGCGDGDRATADLKLAEYIREKYRTPREQRSLSDIPVADVLNIYLTDVVQKKERNKERTIKRIMRLIEWWGDKKLSDVTGNTCRAYCKSRPGEGGARRDLEDLSAAIQHHHEEGCHREHVRVWLPERGEPRAGWLTRKQLAALVWTAWRAREEQRRDHGPGRSAGEGGQALPTKKRTGRHIARAILWGYYTGSRIGDVLRASWVAASDRSFIDLESGLWYRLPTGKKQTNKRQPPIMLADRLLVHVRRWSDFQRKDEDKRGICAAFVVEWEGLPVKSIKTAFRSAVRAAGLPSWVTPHSLRHSRVTHAKLAGVPSYHLGRYVGMSEKMIEDVYGHFDPKEGKVVANAR